MELGADIEAKTDTGKTALHVAVNGDNRKSVFALLKKMANLNAQDDYGQTPLHTAAERDSVEVAKLLIAMIHAGDEKLEVVDKVSGTALHKAAEKGSTRMIDLLLEEGFDLEARTKWQETPLHRTCVYNQSKAARRLLKAGMCGGE